MAHIVKEKTKIMKRIKKIRGQLDAVERSFEKEENCFSILQTLAACRGAMNGLMAELTEDHIYNHVMKNPGKPTSLQDKAALELVELLKTYWK